MPDDDTHISNEDQNFTSRSSISLEDEMRKSYLDYAMSVIVSRALPDCRDGLKPVHRRILYSMMNQDTITINHIRNQLELLECDG